MKKQEIIEELKKAILQTKLQILEHEKKLDELLEQLSILNGDSCTDE